MDIGQILFNLGVSALFAFSFSSRLSRKAKKPNVRWIWFFVIWIALSILSFYYINLP